MKFPAVKDAIHAGWMTTSEGFKHPRPSVTRNYDELPRRPPCQCVGASAYSEEEQSWCAATIQFLVDSLDTAGRQSRGIPGTAATSTPAKDLLATSGAARGRRRARRKQNEDCGDIEDVEMDNETRQPSQCKRLKKQTSKARYPVFGVF